MPLIVMKVAFSFFNMECLWAEAMLSANPTLEPSELHGCVSVTHTHTYTHTTSDIHTDR